ncbi:hypothetical protein Desor_2399 [Desulfosporosinus orientis DSM 765]|uniref:4Fe-4S ferredoxin-type domain-containing protein n=1 Tax=Desulfosporosinus orientis (strain ATCC 19365 / DSM 765 / NCIMB 8382 / VKM B-1628 / Singapore I) TaxID=768706 RepID=G7WF92_DESOD|nr:EFR1 family ferrodoxin [Desulfosporosinus orientis]AET67978.1 hypothetical protein Desor_2399 [Desulfosporosinus orientis DSM 765]
MKIFYFTSTGNSLAIAKKFEAELYSIPQVLKSNTDEFSADAVGIICPVYHFGVPGIVKDFLTTVNINSPYVFALLTYGNMTGNAPGHIDQLASSNGITLSYINTIKMVDNFLPVFDMEKERRKLKESDAEINRKINDIQQRVNHRKISKNPFVIMSTPIIRSVMKETGIEKKFCISKDCTACGICQKVCPKNNVKLDKRPYFGNNCCSCLGCVHMCPQKAITIKGEKNPNARFRNPDVSLKEIIEVNNL